MHEMWVFFMDVETWQSCGDLRYGRCLCLH